MTAKLLVSNTSPLTTVQDLGRSGMLRHGISASGPMDSQAFAAAAAALGGAGPAGIEFTTSGLDIEVVAGGCRFALAGGQFTASLNDVAIAWPDVGDLQQGDRLHIGPGPVGNYGYLRFDKGIHLPLVMGSQATNLRAGIGGFAGRALAAGDILGLIEPEQLDPGQQAVAAASAGPIRVLWGLHADAFPPEVHSRFLQKEFVITSRMDRMGVRLDDPEGVFRASSGLSLVSDAVVAGDIQILGDGTPIVLMRDHQPTGGYPRIATVIGSDLDRLAQMRPGTHVRFESVSLVHAHRLSTLRSASR
ncbi:biotin-dependent carboxyltransferase family protein [Devosia nitrariae]|uniref:Allophanate hydrolase n=1 Tax=Devosia nitrariae TaxID=2071872 RepID=A0ABQ5WCZ5_9HYPH|nr:biotin-dependent carboxyltransferase family protein [Devosia nitrariae]GLQ57664.1 allophanate hydrolase [Devosia nitrariae]